MAWNKLHGAWYERLRKFMLQYGFKASSCDHSLFIYHAKSVQLYALVNVDDILVTGTSPRLIHDLLDKLQATFSFKHLGQPKYFLGFEVTYQSNGSVVLTQTKYICDLLARVKMTECKGVVTPMLSSCKLSKHGHDLHSDPHAYRPIVGALQYITLAGPMLSYSVNKVYQFLSTPLEGIQVHIMLPFSYHDTWTCSPTGSNKLQAISSCVHGLQLG